MNDILVCMKKIIVINLLITFIFTLNSDVLDWN